MSKGAFSDFAHYTAPLRHFGGQSLLRYLVLAIGLISMTAFTVPDVRGSIGVWLSVCLWLSLAYFAIEALFRARAAWGARTPRDEFRWLATLIDLLAVVPVPIALICGVAAPTAWLFACLWVLKLGQDSAGFAQIGRVFVLEARPLASVLSLFLILLFLASAAMHVIERDSQPATFGTLPAALWWAVVTLTTTGYGDAVPHTPLGHLLGSIVMMSGIATFGLWIGILSTGFAAERRRQNFIQTWDIVGKVPFLRDLDPPAITEITHMLRRVEVPDRTAVIRQGKVGDCMYFIAEGEVEVDVSPTPVRLGPGAFFGELALLGDSIRTANVATTKPSTLLILDLADFRAAMAHHSDLARAIDEEGRRRLNENQRWREAQRPSAVRPS
jgi:voltage-gated potassium channel